jgi:hypothetical protein
MRGPVFEVQALRQMARAKQSQLDIFRGALAGVIVGKQAKAVAIPAGFEPATHGVEIRYSIQLSYGTVGRLIPLQIRKIRIAAKLVPNRFPCSGDKASSGGPLALVRPWHTATPPPSTGAKGLGPSTNVACDLFAPLFRRHESVTF